MLRAMVRSRRVEYLDENWTLRWVGVSVGDETLREGGRRKGGQRTSSPGRTTGPMGGWGVGVEVRD